MTPSKAEEKACYLPLVAIVIPEKTTTKTRVVFDACENFDGLSLDDVFFQGPKLQRDIFDVLLRFRRFPVALVCEIAEMYLRIGISSSSRPFHRFLWRDIDQSRPPDALSLELTRAPIKRNLLLRGLQGKTKSTTRKLPR